MATAKFITERWLDAEVVEVLLSPAAVAEFGEDAAKEMVTDDAEQIMVDLEESKIE